MNSRFSGVETLAMEGQSAFSKNHLLANSARFGDRFYNLFRSNPGEPTCIFGDAVSVACPHCSAAAAAAAADDAPPPSNAEQRA